jgi:hypothetical protein
MLKKLIIITAIIATLPLQVARANDMSDYVDSNYIYTPPENLNVAKEEARIKYLCREILTEKNIENRLYDVEAKVYFLDLEVKQIQTSIMGVLAQVVSFLSKLVK